MGIRFNIGRMMFDHTIEVEILDYNVVISQLEAWEVNGFLR